MSIDGYWHQAWKVGQVEIKRLRRERDVAIHEAAHTPSRIAYGYNSEEGKKGYFVGNVWAGEEYLDAIQMIATEPAKEKQ